MDRVGTRHQCLGRGASRIHAGAPKFMAFDNSDSFAAARKPCRQGRPRLAHPNNDCVEVLRGSGHLVPSMWTLPSFAASSGVLPS